MFYEMKNKIIILLALFSGCITPRVAELSVQEIPKPIVPIFSNCGNADGGVNLLINFESRILSGLMLDWIKDESRLAGEISDPFGSNLLTFEKKKFDQDFLFKGRMVDKIPEISTDENGFLEIDGHLIGIKSSELGCFLNYKVPYAWTKHFSRKSNIHNAKSVENGRKYIFEFDDGRRKIWVSYFSKEKKICSKIKWTHLFGLMSQKIRICQTFNSIPWKSRLEFGEGDFIEWSKVD